MDTTTTCAKCDGAGNIGGFEHVQNGVCFACKGTGRISVRAARRSAAAAAAQAHRTARIAALVAAAPEVADRYFAASLPGATLDACKAVLFATGTTDAEAIAATAAVLA